MSVISTSTAAYLLVGWVAASLGACSNDGGRTPPQHDAEVDAGGTGNDAGAAAKGDASATQDAAGRADAAVARVDAGADASADASVDASTAGARMWWESASLTQVSWAPGDCVISVLDDPSQIPPLKWEPLALGNLTGETPVIPAAWTRYRYRELAGGNSWMLGVVADWTVVEVRSPAGEALYGFKTQGCSADAVARTSRGVCVHFSSREADLGALACGDLHRPEPLIEIPKHGFLHASSEEVTVIEVDGDHKVLFVDLRDERVIETTAVHSFSEATAHGRDAFTLNLAQGPVNSYRGVIYRWDGASGYEMVWDPMTLGVVNVHALDGELVWTETELGSPKTGTSIYRAPWPPAGATLDPTLVRKLDQVSFEGMSVLAAGQLAIRGSNRIDLVDLNNGARRTVFVGARWSASNTFLNERSLVLWLFDKPDINAYLSFRVNLSDVLSLPAD